MSSTVIFSKNIPDDLSRWFRLNCLKAIFMGNSSASAIPTRVERYWERGKMFDRQLFITIIFVRFDILFICSINYVVNYFVGTMWPEIHNGLYNAFGFSVKPPSIHRRCSQCLYFNCVQTDVRCLCSIQSYRLLLMCIVILCVIVTICYYYYFFFFQCLSASGPIKKCT